MRNKKFANICLPLLFFPFWAWSEEKVTFTASAPKILETGEQFQLKFTVSSSDTLTFADVKDLLIPQLQDFKIVFGPARSVQKIERNISDKKIIRHEIVYLYILSTPNTGKFKIPEASIMVQNQRFYSKPLFIRIVPNE